MKNIWLKGIIILCLLSLLVVSNKVKAMELQGELHTVLKANEIKVESSRMGSADVDSYLKLNCQGYVGAYEYLIDLTGDLQDFSLNWEQVTLSSLAAGGVLEIGKKDWVWGKGFTYPATYPLKKDEAYWGGEWQKIYPDYHLSLGVALEDGQDTTSWLRWGKAWPGSDCTGVLSWQDKGKLNLGWNFSRDFNELTTYGGFNLFSQAGKRGYNYLWGLEYLAQDRILILENYYRDNNYLFFSLGKAAIFSNWEWNLQELINLDDYGRREALQISYVQNDYLLPSLEIFSFSDPEHWGFSLNLKMIIIN